MYPHILGSFFFIVIRNSNNEIPSFIVQCGSFRSDQIKIYLNGICDPESIYHRQLISYNHIIVNKRMKYYLSQFQFLSSDDTK